MKSDVCIICNKPATSRRLIGIVFDEKDMPVNIFAGLCDKHTMDDIKKLAEKDTFFWESRPHDEIGLE